MSEVFRRALAPVRAALEEYRVPEREAAAVETDLAAWLIRYAKRNPNSSDESKTMSLVSLACSFGRGYQARAGRQDTGDRKFAALLRESPDVVAERIFAAFGHGSSSSLARDLWTRMRALARRSPDPDREK